MAEFQLRSSAFEHGDPIPQAYSCEGDDRSPPLSWSGTPEGTRSLALIVDDPDAPPGTFVHWVGWGIDPSAAGLDEGEAPAFEGENGFERTGYGGPCPPPGHGRHRYFFHLNALDADPEVSSGADREELEKAIKGHVLGTAELMGGYERS